MKTCQYCGSTYDDTLSYCPSCGATSVNAETSRVQPVSTMEEIPSTIPNKSETKSKSKKTIILAVALALVLLGIIGALMEDDETTNSSTVSESNQNITQSANETQQEPDDENSSSDRPDSYWDPIESATYYCSYVNKGVEAINTGDLSLLNGMCASASLYEQQSKLVARLNNKEIKETFLTGRFEIVDNDEEDIAANIYEKHRIIGNVGQRYTDCFYSCRLIAQKPYSIKSMAKGINPFKPLHEAYITEDYTDLYVLPKADALVFDRAMRGDCVKVCEYPESDALSMKDEVFELSPNIKDAENQIIPRLTVKMSEVQNEWTFIKHSQYGYAWVRNGGLSQ